MSTEQPTCFGCYTTPPPWPQNPQGPGSFMNSFVGITIEEKLVLESLGEAWERFKILSIARDDYNKEFLEGIHRCQSIIALQIARRVNSEIWK